MNLVPMIANLPASDMKTAKLMHDLKSPLTAVKILRARLDPNGDESNLLGATIRQLELLLSSCVGTFTDQSENVSAADLQQICEQLVAEKRVVTRARVTLDWQVADFDLRISRLEIYRVLSNLMHNACQALDGQRGVIDVKVRRNGKMLSIEVRNEATEPRVAKKSRGWGLGLLIVQDILSLRRGFLSSEAEPYGMRIDVRLPIND